MPVYTLISYGKPSRFKAKDVKQLAVRLYRRTAWTWDGCERIARKLVRGVVYSAPDYETLVLRGDWSWVESRPEERDPSTWDGRHVATPEAARAARGDLPSDADAPLLSGGVK